MIPPDVSPPRPRPNALGGFAVSVEGRDGMRWWTWISVGGLAASVLLAVIGGFPLDTPMPTHSFGWVEPTCGLTRGSTAIARGDFSLAWRYNPASFLVIAVGAAGLLRAVVGTLTHRWLRVAISLRWAGWAVAAVAFVGLWAHQQSNAEFIINSRA